jgi:hypothetical protein
MERRNPVATGWMIRLGGVATLLVACLSGHRLAEIGIGRSGHEPPIAYVLALITFIGGSIGVTLATFGRRLTAKVMVADRWLPHVPIAFRQEPAAPAPRDIA